MTRFSIDNLATRLRGEPAALSEDGQSVVEAAVLIALIPGDEDADIILTRRADHMRHHPGQIAFPGGRRERGETAWEAACREAHEEIGLAPNAVERLGYLNPLRTGTGFMVQPCVGLVHKPFRAMPNPEEVAEVFLVPSIVLFDRRRYEETAIPGFGVRMPALRYRRHLVWGATAGMIGDIIDLLEPA